MPQTDFTPLLWAAIVEPIRDGYVPILLVLAVLDTLLGIAVAVKTRTFDLSRLADWLETAFLYKVLAWYALAVVVNLAGSGLLGELGQTVAPTAGVGSFGVVLAAMVADVVKKVGQLGVTVEVHPDGPADPAHG